MTTRSLGFMALAVAVLAGVYFLTTPQQRPSSQSQPNLLSRVRPEEIHKVVLEQGEDEVILELKDSTWTLPARNNYPANTAKVRSLMLKLLDLSASQSLPYSEEGVKRLGLDEQAIEGGNARVRFFDAAGEELGGVILGNTRTPQGESDNPFGMGGGGQYVKPTDRDEIYLVGLPVSVVASISNWLDNTVLNVPSSRVVKVEQVHLKDAQEEDVLFTIEREGEELELTGDVPEGKELQKALVSQVGSGLENLTVLDVHGADDQAISGISFDYRTDYRTSNGLVYSIETAEADGKAYGRIAVVFDEKLAQSLKDGSVAEKEEAEEQGQSDAEAPAGEEGAEQAGNTAEEERAVALSSPEEAERIAARLRPWVFSLAEYQGQKFRRNRESLMRDKDVQADTSAAIGEEA